MDAQETVKVALEGLDEMNQMENVSESLISLMDMDDDQFNLIAPGILQSFQQAINNPNDQLTLVQVLNAQGLKAEDLTSEFLELQELVRNMDLSAEKRSFLVELFASIITAINETEGISKKMVPIAIELCHENAKIPQYAHITDSGADVFALDEIIVHPGETVLVPTGLKIAPPPGYEVQVRAKSGRALKTKLRIGNAIGTIDQGYRDEIKIILENIEPKIKDITIDEDGKVTSIEYGQDYIIGKGEKFCQLILSEVPKMSFYRIDSVSEIGEDRGGGFGSCGADISSYWRLMSLSPWCF